MVWTIFSWFIFVCKAPQRACSSSASSRTEPCSDGMLIYKQLGADAESQFANQWGVGYAMDKCVAGLTRLCGGLRADARLPRPLHGSASEWKDVGITAVKTALVLVRASVLAPSCHGLFL